MKNIRSSLRRERFVEEYKRLDRREVFFMDRFAHLNSDPGLRRQAQILQFLIPDMDPAHAALNLIASAGMDVLHPREWAADHGITGESWLQLTATQAQNTGNPTQAVIDFLVKGSMVWQRERTHGSMERPLPDNDMDLRKEVESLLQSNLPEACKDRLRTILFAIGRCRYAHCLELYSRFLERMAGMH